MADRIDVENVGQPGKTYRVDAAKYALMKRAVLGALPDQPPGIDVATLVAAVRPGVTGPLFPEGKTCGWWVKCVQLDLEAKGIIVRSPKSPVRLYKT